jgi:hypothetical protein
VGAVFKTGAFNRSVTHPGLQCEILKHGACRNNGDIPTRRLSRRPRAFKAIVDRARRLAVVFDEQVAVNPQRLSSASGRAPGRPPHPA